VRSIRTTRVILLAIALALFAVVSAPLASVAQTASTSSLLVKLIDGLAPEQQAEIIARNGGVEVSSIPALRLHVIQIAPADLPQVLASYQADPQVVNAEENKTRQSRRIRSIRISGHCRRSAGTWSSELSRRRARRSSRFSIPALTLSTPTWSGT